MTDTFTHEQVEAVAKGLTKDQRELLKALPTIVVEEYDPRRALIGLGLAIVVRPGTDRLHATAFGLAVRAYLERTNA